MLFEMKLLAYPCSPYDTYLSQKLANRSPRGTSPLAILASELKNIGRITFTGHKMI